VVNLRDGTGFVYSGLLAILSGSFKVIEVLQVIQKKSIKFIFLVGALFSAFAAFTGCTFAPVCNQQGAYSQGVTDGRFRVPENYNYAATCPQRRGRINRSYHRGYRHGLNMSPVIVPVPVPVPGPGSRPWHPHPWGPNPWHPHGGHHGHHGHHPHPGPGPRPRPHHHHGIIPGVPTPPVQTHVVRPVIPGVPTPPAQTHIVVAPHATGLLK
jgi:hypothetical protein